MCGAFDSIWPKKLRHIGDIGAARACMFASVQNALDQIASYNEAAAELGGGTTGITAGLVGGGNAAGGAPFFLNGKYYRYVNGRLQEVK